MPSDNYELECVYEDLTRCETRLELAVKLIEQYRAEIKNRTDLVEAGFCQGAWFEDSYHLVASDGGSIGPLLDHLKKPINGR